MTTNQVGERIERVDLIEASWSGVCESLRSLYSANSGINSKNIDVFGTPDPDDYAYLQQQKGGVLEYPVIAVTLSQVNNDVGSFNTSVMRKHGVTVGWAKNRVDYLMLKASPTELSFSVTLITDDMKTLLAMVSRWMSNELWGFTLRYDEWSTKIKVLADKNLAIPNRVPGSDGSRQFRLTSTLRASTYAGFLYKVPSIRTVNATVMIPKNATIEEAIKKAESLGQIFAITEFTKKPGDAYIVFEPEV